MRYYSQMDDRPRIGLRTAVFGAVLLVGVGFFIGTIAKPGQPWAANATTSGAYISPDDLTPLIQAWQTLDANFASGTTTEGTTKQEKIWGAISGLTASYGDQHTVFFPPVRLEEFETEVRGNFEGVGMEIAVRDNMLVVVAPLKNTPAFRAGIQSGDHILKIDGADTARITVEKAVSLIRGEGGTSVVLTLSREGKKPFEVTVTRETILLPTIDTQMRADSGIFVISLYNFNAQVPQMFRDAVSEFAGTGSRKLILDLRGNPGGYLEVSVEVASWFLPVGKPVVIEDFSNVETEQVHRSRGYNYFGSNVQTVVLVDEGSASASEILAGALRDHGKATLIGTKTFGKGSVQQLFDLPDNGALKITIAQWLTPNGVSISHEGIVPDYTIERTEEDRNKGVDPQLDAAVKFLSGQSIEVAETE